MPEECLFGRLFKVFIPALMQKTENYSAGIMTEQISCAILGIR